MRRVSMQVNAIAVLPNRPINQVIREFDGNKFNMVYIIGKDKITAVDENKIYNHALKNGIDKKIGTI